MAVEEQVRQIGDIQIALAATLTRGDGTTAVDVTSLTVKFAMYDSQGNVKVAESVTGVTKVVAATGKVSKTFLAADVNTAGTFYAYFITEDASGYQDTFPAKTGELKVTIEPVS